MDFLEGDPDQPMIVGSLYNADQMPPYDLPTNQTVSGIKTRSSKLGGTDNYNEIRFEDKKGSESLDIHGEKNLDFSVEYDASITVGNNATFSAGRDALFSAVANLTISVPQRSVRLRHWHRHPQRSSICPEHGWSSRCRFVPRRRLRLGQFVCRRHHQRHGQRRPTSAWAPTTNTSQPWTPMASPWRQSKA